MFRRLAATTALAVTLSLFSDGGAQTLPLPETAPSQVEPDLSTAQVAPATGAVDHTATETVESSSRLAEEVLPEREPEWTSDQNTAEQVTPDAAPAAERDAGPRLAIGRARLHPLGGFGVRHDDNILLDDEGKQSDVIFGVSAGLALGLGDYLEKRFNYAWIAYAPTLVLFQDHDEFNAVDQRLRAEGQFVTERFTLSPFAHYDKTSEADRDTRGRRDRHIYSAGFETAYRMSEKTSLEVNITGWIREHEDGIDSDEFYNTNWFNFHVTPKTDIDLGAAFGVLQVEGAGDQTYQQALLRARVASTVKLAFNGNVGVEFRQIDDNIPDRITPVFGLGLTYNVSEGSVLKLEGSRRVQSSITLAGQNYTSTRIGGGLDQHLWRNFFVDVAGGYERADYNRTAQDVVAGREDDYFYVRPALDYRMRDWLKVSAFYLYRKNDSNSGDDRFENRQVGLQAVLGF